MSTAEPKTVVLSNYNENDSSVKSPIENKNKTPLLEPKPRSYLDKRNSSLHSVNSSNKPLDKRSVDYNSLKRDMKEYLEKIIPEETKRALKGMKLPKCNHVCGYMNNQPPYASQPFHNTDGLVETGPTRRKQSNDKTENHSPGEKYYV
jgi:hypothetical protein